MGANIVQYKDKNDNLEYPRTTADAVGMPDGSGSLTKKLLELESNMGKVDVVDDLTTGGRDKALSAEQGKVLRTMLRDATGYTEEIDLLPKFSNGYGIRTGEKVGDTATLELVKNDLFQYGKFPCKEGDYFIISGYGGARATRLYSIIDSFNKVLEVAPENYRVSNKRIEIAYSDAAFFVCNFITGNGEKLLQGEGSKAESVLDAVKGMKPKVDKHEAQIIKIQSQIGDFKSAPPVPYVTVAGQYVSAKDMIIKNNTDYERTEPILLTGGHKYAISSKGAGFAVASECTIDGKILSIICTNSTNSPTTTECEYTPKEDCYVMLSGMKGTIKILDNTDGYAYSIAQTLDEMKSEIGEVRKPFFVGKESITDINVDSLSWAQGKYININGKIAENPKYRYSSPISLDVGQTLEFRAVTLRASAISLLQENGSYKVLVEGDDYRAKTYKYTSNVKSQIIVCAETIESIVTKDKPHSVINSFKRGLYISRDGITKENWQYSITDYIILLKGDYIKIRTKGAGFAAISKVKGTIYPLIYHPSESNPDTFVEYKYLATDDTVVIACGRTEGLIVEVYSIDNRFVRAEKSAAAALSKDSSYADDGEEKPDTIGLGNVIKRIQEWVNFKWVPKRFVPAASSSYYIGISKSKGNFSVRITDSSAYKNATDNYFNKIDGSYELNFRDNYWYYDGKAISLSSMGVTLSGSPIDGDMIIIRYSTALPLGTPVFLPTENKGMPWGRSVEYENCMNRTSYKTFFTALNNPNSKFYTENTMGPFYAGVCAHLSTYAYNLGKYDTVVASETFREYRKINHVEDVHGHIKIGDTIYKWNPGSQIGHVGVISKIVRSGSKISEIYVAEVDYPRCFETKHTPQSFFDKWVNRKTCGQPVSKIFGCKEDFMVDYEQSPYVTLPGQVPMEVIYNEDLGLDKGEDTWYKVGDKVQISAYNAKYNEAVLSKVEGGSSVEIKRISLSQFKAGYGNTKIYDIETLSMEAGEYKVVLSGTSGLSASVTFLLIDTGHIALTERGTCTFDGYSSNLEPVCFFWRDAGHFYYFNVAKEIGYWEVADGECKIPEPNIDCRDPYACIMYKCKFGYVAGERIPRKKVV